jgi:SAM-dependent methyltransferase
MPTSAPVPPVELATRVGRLPGDPLEVYERIGRLVREEVESLLPQDWSWRGKRVLDFGCGSARVLRQFLEEAQEAEFWGCDTHGPSVEWVQENLCPPLHCFQNDVEPGLPLEDGHFDLVWATSVFTHITGTWAEWLLELHRVLSPGGLLISTYLARQKWEARLKEPYDEERAGMTMVPDPESQYLDGPGLVFHSEWWLREHWGRAFEIVEIDHPQAASDGGEPLTQNFLLARKRPVSLTAEELERLNPDDSRELESLRTNVRVLMRESGSLRDDRLELRRTRHRLQERLPELEQRVHRLQQRNHELQQRLRRLQLTLYGITKSRSWRLTAPLRTLAERARGLRAKKSRARSRS